MLRALSETEQSTYLETRAARARPGQMAEIPAKPGTAGVVPPEDELPEDWPPPEPDRDTAAPGV